MLKLEKKTGIPVCRVDHYLMQITTSVGASESYLCDGQSLVEVTQCVELPLLALHGNVELPDSLKSQFLFLHQDPE